MEEPVWFARLLVWGPDLNPIFWDELEYKRKGKPYNIISILDLTPAVVFFNATNEHSVEGKMYYSSPPPCNFVSTVKYRKPWSSMPELSGDHILADNTWSGIVTQEINACH